jgi:hypothetical protein
LCKPPHLGHVLEEIHNEGSLALCIVQGVKHGFPTFLEKQLVLLVTHLVSVISVDKNEKDEL